MIILSIKANIECSDTINHKALSVTIINKTTVIVQKYSSFVSLS